MPKGSESSRSLNPSDGLIGEFVQPYQTRHRRFRQRVPTRKLEHIAASTQIANFNGGRAMRSPPIPQTELHRFCGQDYDRFGVVRLSHGASRHPKPLKRI